MRRRRIFMMATAAAAAAPPPAPTPADLTNLVGGFKGDAGMNTDEGAHFVSASSQNLSVSSADFRPGSADFWLSVWFYPTANGAEKAVSGVWGGSTNEWVLDVISGEPKFFVGGGTVAWGATVALNTWHHAFCWRDATAGTVNMSIDNGTAVSVSVAAPTAGNSPMRIGAYGSTAGQFFDGDIDSWAFGKPPTAIAALVAAMRAALWNGGNGCTIASLTAGQKSAWGLTSGYDFRDTGSLTTDVQAVNTLTNNGSVTIGAGAVQTSDIADTEGISKWADQSSNNNKVVQAVAAKRPAYRSTAGGALNLIPVAKPDAVDDVLLNTALAALDSTSAGFAIFGVIRTGSNVATYRSLLGLGASGANGIDIRVQSSKLQAYINNGGSFAGITSTTTITTLQAITFCIVFAPNAYPLLYINAGASEGAVQGTTVALPTGTWGLALLGNRYADGGQFGNTDIAECFACNSVPTAQQRADMFSYMNSRFAVY
jgi:hypothetical protein